MQALEATITDLMMNDIIHNFKQGGLPMSWQNITSSVLRAMVSWLSFLCLSFSITLKVIDYLETIGETPGNKVAPKMLLSPMTAEGKKIDRRFDAQILDDTQPIGKINGALIQFKAASSTQVRAMLELSQAQKRWAPTFGNMEDFCQNHNTTIPFCWTPVTLACQAQGNGTLRRIALASPDCCLTVKTLRF